MSSARRAAFVAVAAVGLALVAPALAQPATIYGMIREGGRPLPNAGIDLVCGGRRDAGRTDDRGAYRFTVSQTGRCELRAGGGVAAVILYDQPTRYDFELQRQGGRTELIRR
jgi:hypothetical protein